MSDQDPSRLVLGVRQGRLPSLAQLRYSNDLLTPRERVVIMGCWLLAVVAVVFLGIYHYLATTTAVPASGGEYREALVGHPQYINPVLAQTNYVDMDLSRLLFSGLFRRTTDQRLEPDLVTDYEISEDQLTYTLYIRRDAVWHDGQPLTTNDVVFTLQANQATTK